MGGELDWYYRMAAVADRFLPQFIHPAVVVTAVPLLVVLGACPVYYALDPRIDVALYVVSGKLFLFAIITTTPWTTAGEPVSAQVLHGMCLFMILLFTCLQFGGYESTGSLYDLLVLPIVVEVLLCNFVGYFIAIRCGRRNAFGEYMARTSLKDTTQPESEHMV
ncbi:hypothetical protein MKEN_01273000 [Mycena kentingensis (nom. inval.)]|nr:hypothetical protein MKEN_01273000 [Mycena kentingensis (nom. inval.)]